MFPLRQLQSLGECLACKGGESVRLGAEQIFLEALIEPSLQTNCPLRQWSMPPLRPEHGVLAACAAWVSMSAANVHKMYLLGITCFSLSLLGR